MHVQRGGTEEEKATQIVGVTILCAGGVGGLMVSGEEIHWILTFPLLGFLTTTKSLSTTVCHPMMLCVIASPALQSQVAPLKLSSNS